MANIQALYTSSSFNA